MAQKDWKLTSSQTSSSISCSYAWVPGVDEVIDPPKHCTPSPQNWSNTLGELILVARGRTITLMVIMFPASISHQKLIWRLAWDPLLANESFAEGFWENILTWKKEPREVRFSPSPLKSECWQAVLGAARGTRLNVRPMLEKEEQGDEQNCKSEHIFELPTLKAMIPPDFSGYVLIVCVCVCVTQLCPTLCYSMDCSQTGSSVHGVLLARILEWVAVPFAKGASWPRDQTQVSCIAGGCFTVRATREAY